MMYSLDTDWDYLTGDGDEQVFSRIDAEIRKQFVTGFVELSAPLTFVFNKRAKLSDVLSQGGIVATGFLVNKKVKGILDCFNLMDHRYYYAEVFRNDGIEEYYWLQLWEDLSEEIDFQQTVFMEVHLSTAVGDIKLDSLKHYEELKAKKGWEFRAKTEQVVVKSGSRLAEMDMFNFAPFNRTICISERLKNALEEHGITGISIEEYQGVKFGS